MRPSQPRREVVRPERKADSGILGPVVDRAGGAVEATGLSTTEKEYRARLAEQSDDQIDAWVSELMRDVAIRRGVIRVIEDFERAARIDDRAFERVFAFGGGPPAAI